MIALSDIARVLGAMPGWDAASQQASLRMGSRTIAFRMGSDQAEVDGQATPVGVAPLQVNTEPFVPLRFVVETLGATVSWDGPARTVQVQLPTRHRWRMMQPENKSWWDANGYPEAYTGAFWAPDTARELPPVAFGTLGYHQSLPVSVSIRSYSLRAPLPEVPSALPVYLQGAYPPEFKERFAQLVERPWEWYLMPQWGLMVYQGDLPIGESAPVRSPEEAERRAAELLGPLLQGDYRAVVRREPDGWRVTFYRVANGVRLVGRPLTVVINSEGQATYIGGRRRPLLAWSSYPLLPPEEAWQLLREGRWLQLYIDEPQLTGTVDTFVVTEVELIYHDQHADFALQTMPPYYAFRNAEGYALYVPALAYPYTTWP